MVDPSSKGHTSTGIVANYPYLLNSRSRVRTGREPEVAIPCKAEFAVPRRHLVLGREGIALVNTDLHGNREDFDALEKVFHAERAAHPVVHWVILGDIVHAPSEEARESDPTLYDFDDGSFAIAERIAELQIAYPDRIHFVLGNHDYGHIGGPRTSKFHADEVMALEMKLSEDDRRFLYCWLERSLFLVAAPCGVLLTHGSPDTQVTSLDMFDDLELPSRSDALRTLLCSYGQPKAVTDTMLAQVSAKAELELRVVVHGHDKTEDGFFYEGDNQVCPCLFGAPRHAKRYVRLDLAARYERAEDLRDGFEIRRLWE